MIVIIDLNSGNLSSIENAFSKINVTTNTTNDLSKIKNASKIIIPGVGSFDNYIKSLHNLNLINLLNEKVLVNKVPILGICAGMQIMTDGSDEGTTKGLSWISGYTHKFKSNTYLKVPHIGWNKIIPNKKNLLFQKNAKFYFCHSYYVKTKNKYDSLSETTYGVSFNSIIQRENIYGCQFHPEKSHDDGLSFLNNFINKI